jgi:hypothetical protein
MLRSGKSLQEKAMIIQHENARPAWYELSVKDEKTLVIRAHRSALEILLGVTAKSAIVTHYMHQFGFRTFIPPTETSWGFGSCLSRVHSVNPDWVVWECVLPVQCRTSFSMTNVLRSYAVRATLSILFEALGLEECDNGSAHSQLMVVETMRVESCAWGAMLFVTLTAPLCSWLTQHGTQEVCVEVALCMDRTYAHLWRLKRYREQCQVRLLPPNRLIMVVPGNACDLSPEDNYLPKHDPEYRLTPHNTDNSMQQFLFLMGLAKLQDVIRKDLSP